MSASNQTRHEAEGLKYGTSENAKATETLECSTSDIGQRDPRHCPQSESTPVAGSTDSLGEPKTIREVARILGCSEWTVRQRYLPMGLPHFRLSPAGKLLFFQNQIVRLVLEKQRQKGSYTR
jgi:hypothetical protein